jgi:hypothetical protein
MVNHRLVVVISLALSYGALSAKISVKKRMWGDIVFVLVIMVAAITIYHLIVGPGGASISGLQRTRNLTPIQVLQQKDADAFVNGPISPGPAALADKTAPYTLLDIPAYRGKSGVTTIGSQSCYQRDSTNQRMKSSYAQMVNNYPHEYPDTCSGTRQEMILGVYQTPQ